MISECPHCNQALRFSDANKERVMSALEKLPQGQTLKFKCPLCREVIELNPDGMPASPDIDDLQYATDRSDQTDHLGQPGQSAHSGQSEFQSGIQKSGVNEAGIQKGGSQKTSSLKGPEKYSDTISVQPPVPPVAPDISWLSEGGNIDAGALDNIMTAMILVPDGGMRSTISETFKADSYQVYVPGSIDEAIESLRFKDYAAIVYHSAYEDKPLKDQDFHRFMCQMSMNKRRYIQYMLVGPGFRTLYDLEALASSATVVINDRELPYFKTILAKQKSDYNSIFRAYCTMLKEHGKS